MYDVYTWFIAWSNKRQRDVGRMNAKAFARTLGLLLCLQYLVSKVEVTVRFLQNVAYCLYSVATKFRFLMRC